MMRSTLVLLAVVLVACSSASEPPIVERTAVSSVAPAATRLEAETSTTAAAREVDAVDAVASGAELDDEADLEALVLELHARVMGELFARDERIDGPEVHLPLASEISTGPLLARIRESAAAKLGSGERSAGDGYASNPLSVELEGQSAVVLDCSRDLGERYAADGSLLVAADDFWIVRRVEYRKVNDQWFAWEIFSGGETRCDPAPSS